MVTRKQSDENFSLLNKSLLSGRITIEVILNRSIRRAFKYNNLMEKFLFTHPLEVRYSDLDPQWHVNNARFLSFFEQGRFEYLIFLGLWDGKDFLDLKSIIADIHVSYDAPIALSTRLMVGVRVTKLGGKSLTFYQELWDGDNGQVFSRCETVIVTFDYRNQKSIAVPDEWREKISAFEKTNFLKGS